jgi:hypothetical protein
MFIKFETMIHLSFGATAEVVSSLISTAAAERFPSATAKERERERTETVVSFRLAPRTMALMVRELLVAVVSWWCRRRAL